MRSLIVSLLLILHYRLRNIPSCIRCKSGISRLRFIHGPSRHVFLSSQPPSRIQDHNPISIDSYPVVVSVSDDPMSLGGYMGTWRRDAGGFDDLQPHVASKGQKAWRRVGTTTWDLTHACERVQASDLPLRGTHITKHFYIFFVPSPSLTLAKKIERRVSVRHHA